MAHCGGAIARLGKSCATWRSVETGGSTAPNLNPVVASARPLRLGPTAAYSGKQSQMPPGHPRLRPGDAERAEGRELVMARWGMPSPLFALKGRNSDPGVTNIRNVASPHWRRWLGVESRCVVPFSSFSENEPMPDGSRPPVCFALDESRPLAFFTGLWTRWTSVRKVKEGETITTYSAS
jgi:putative SOS response-associated peptidase YedK